MDKAESVDEVVGFENLRGARGFPADCEVFVGVVADAGVGLAPVDLSNRIMYGV
jgi:hypothetical protein